ncbi:MAG: hypothetical protein WC451_01715 [Patescibacteria group bacterium]
MTCEQVMNNGKQCKANAMHNSKFCFMHDPNTKDQVKEAGRKGGQVSCYKKGLIQADPIDILTDGKMVAYLLADTINRVRQVDPDGSLDIKAANCIGFLTSKLLEAQKQLETERRLKRIEKALDEQGILK